MHEQLGSDTKATMYASIPHTWMRLCGMLVHTHARMHVTYTHMHSLPAYLPTYIQA